MRSAFICKGPASPHMSWQTSRGNSRADTLDGTGSMSRRRSTCDRSTRYLSQRTRSAAIFVSPPLEGAADRCIGAAFALGEDVVDREAGILPFRAQGLAASERPVK